MGADLRYAIRALRKNPTFTIAAVLTLGLCIGANAALFGVVDAVLLRPLPYPEPERIGQVVIEFQGPKSAGLQINQDGRAWEAVREQAPSLDAAVFSDTASGVNFSAGTRVEHLQQQRVSAGFFRILGVRPFAGREFTRDEDQAGGPAAVVLSHSLWKRAFDGDPSVIGGSVLLRGEPHTIVGVMPPGLRTSVAAELWTPLRPSTSGEGGGANYSIIARLRPGVSWARADAEIASVGVAVMEKLRLPRDVSARLRLISFQRGLSDSLRRPLLVLWAAVGSVLLIGCFNIASLLLARGKGRSREIAIRVALGSGRAAVVRQLLVESVLLAACGGAAGILIGSWGISGLKQLLPAPLQPWQQFGLDARVLAATIGLSLLTSLVFGLLPALQATQVDVRTSLTESGTRAVAGGHGRWRRLLVTSEVAIGVVLLITAGLLIRTFASLRGLEPGFDPANLLTAQISLQDARYKTAHGVTRLFELSLERIREAPGVESAAVGLCLPYERPLNSRFVRLDGPHLDGKSQSTNACYLTPDYFATLRVPLRRGRGPQTADGAQAPAVVIVNEAFVRRYLSEQEALGSHISLYGQPRAIVGVVGDVPFKAGFDNYAPLDSMPGVFLPVAQMPDGVLQLVHTWFSPSWIVRTARPEGAVGALQRAVQGVDPLLPFASFKTASAVRHGALSQQRFQTVLLTLLASLALMLAAIGVYGLIANAVVERTRELGIRMALGATVGQAMRDAALPGVGLSFVGVLIGCLLARFSSQLLRGLLWGVTTTDLTTYIAVALGLLLVAAAASLIPSLRVARIDPAAALRNE